MYSKDWHMADIRGQLLVNVRQMNELNRSDYIIWREQPLGIQATLGIEGRFCALAYMQRNTESDLGRYRRTVDKTVHSDCH